MGKGRKVLSDEHARALIKEALGKMTGDTETETEAAAELADIRKREALGKGTKRPAPAKRD